MSLPRACRVWCAGPDGCPDGGAGRWYAAALQVHVLLLSCSLALGTHHCWGTCCSKQLLA